MILIGKMAPLENIAVLDRLEYIRRENRRLAAIPNNLQIRMRRFSVAEDEEDAVRERDRGRKRETKLPLCCRQR